MSKDEVTRGGSNVLRHQEAQASAAAATDEAAAHAVIALIERHCGAPTNVFHELVSETVHLDVHVVPPDPAAGEDGMWTLFTTGMSDLPMTVPAELQAPRYAELMVRLPASWQVSQEAFADPRWYWPVHWLKMLARLPHTYRTWLGDGHTIPNGDPARPLYEGSPFVGVVIGQPTSLPDDDDTAHAGEKAIAILTPYPLYADELTFKLERGWGELVERLGAADVDDCIDPTRASVAKAKKRR
jgi:hypothetical protein